MSDKRTPEVLTLKEFAALARIQPSYCTQLKREGRLVMTEDGKMVLVTESLARIEATRDPSKTGVAARHAEARGEAALTGHLVSTDGLDASVGSRDEQRGRGPAGDASLGNSYQQARAVKEKFLALEAKRAYEVAIGQLREAREVEGLAATAMTEMRLRLENLATTLAPELAAMSDETRVRAALQDQFAHALESASHHFSRLAAGHKS